MTKEGYEKISASIRRRPFQTKALGYLDKLLTVMTFLSYPLVLAALYTGKSPLLYESILVPAVGFVVVSIFRRIVNRPRPYETLEIDPLIKKKTSGKSFPSRHVFSTFILAMTYFRYSSTLGLALLIFGILSCEIRVVGGVHYPSDVIAGAVLGILIGFIGYWLICPML